jgi:hypothetical protein
MIDTRLAPYGALVACLLPPGMSHRLFNGSRVPMTEESRRRLVEVAPGFSIRVRASASTEASALPSVLSAIEALDVMGKGWVKLEAGQAEHVGPNIRHAIRISSRAQAADGHDRSHGVLLPDIGAPASGPSRPRQGLRR